MFSSLMMNTWIAASIVAVIAGITGFFAVLRGQTFAAHAIPNGAFAGAAGAALLGIDVIWGLAAFAIAGALGIGALGSKARHDVVTALTLVLMLGLGGLFVSFSNQYADQTYSLLFGEVFGIGPDEVQPIAWIGLAAIVAIAVAFRRLMLTSAMPEVAEARGVSVRGMEIYFLVVMALATAMTVPVVGALLMFSLMIGPAAAARSVTGAPIPVEYIPPKPGEMPAVIVDVSAARALGYAPTHDLLSGIATVWPEWAPPGAPDGPRTVEGEAGL